MIAEWRDFAYPLGFMANLCFFLRFIYQWGNSELKKKSIVDPTFWKISLFGNTIMVLHTMIQLQLGVLLIQTVNGMISWRNLNLMKEPKKQWTFRSTTLIFIATIALAAICFLLQCRFQGTFIFARTPQFLGRMAAHPLPLTWHIFGMGGATLFASRFWIQWWCSEKRQKSTLGKSFWWISLIGAAISSVYFIMMADVVNFIGPAIGMIPYIRNLILIKKQQVYDIDLLAGG